jgi:Putative MetA-pathway of phenol degradation
MRWIWVWMAMASGVLGRELATDRPDTTESAMTVPKGRFQIEAEVLAHSWKDGHSASWTVVESLLKYGLTDRLDVHLNVPSYAGVRGEDGAWREGFGDLALRMKYNLWGNDEGRSALAVLPYVSAPTAADGVGAESWELGVAFPFSLELTDRFGIGMQQQFDWVAAEDGGKDLEWLQAVVVSVSVTEKTGVFAEGVVVLPFEGEGATEVSVNLGGTYRFTPECQLDAGIRVGLAGEVDDAQLFLGWSQRF